MEKTVAIGMFRQYAQMMFRAIAFLLLTTLPLSAQEGSKPILIEAESIQANGDSSIKDDPTALSKQYVTHKGEYQPLVLVSIPATVGDRVTIWARVRGYSICLKAVQSDNSQKELQWLWEVGKDWTWRSFGTFDKTQLGKAVTIIRAPGGEENAGIDAILFDSGTFDPSKATTEAIESLLKP